MELTYGLTHFFE